MSTVCAVFVLQVLCSLLALCLSCRFCVHCWRCVCFVGFVFTVGAVFVWQVLCSLLALCLFCRFYVHCLCCVCFAGFVFTVGAVFVLQVLSSLLALHGEYYKSEIAADMLYFMFTLGVDSDHPAMQVYLQLAKFFINDTSLDRTVKARGAYLYC